jgi:hypothetical protein
LSATAKITWAGHGLRDVVRRLPGELERKDVARTATATKLLHNIDLHAVGHWMSSRWHYLGGINSTVAAMSFS